MQLLSSDWLKRMVMKSSSNTKARISCLFTILQDWLDAPGMREQLMAARLDSNDHQQLNAFLKKLAADAKLSNPDKLAFQLTFLLLGALNEEVRNPGSCAMLQAREAAISLVDAAKPSYFHKPHMAVFASFIAVAFVGSVVGNMFLPTRFSADPSKPDVLPIQTRAKSAPRPDALVAIYQMNNKIKTGQCSYPQALMLAAHQRSIFMEGVVNIEQLNTSSTNLDEVRKLYQKVTCNYAPAAMQL